MTGVPQERNSTVLPVIAISRSILCSISSTRTTPSIMSHPVLPSAYTRDTLHMGNAGALLASDEHPPRWASRHVGHQRCGPWRVRISPRVVPPSGEPGLDSATDKTHRRTPPLNRERFVA